MNEGDDLVKQSGMCESTITSTIMYILLYLILFALFFLLLDQSDRFRYISCILFISTGLVVRDVQLSISYCSLNILCTCICCHLCLVIFNNWYSFYEDLFNLLITALEV